MKHFGRPALEGYTDGGCHNNPGPGGWGWAIYDGTTMKVDGLGGKAHTTNNQMEMTAMLKLLNYCVETGTQVQEIYSDSSLVIKGINEWMQGWKSRGWRKAGNKALQNKDLWMCIDHAILLYKGNFGKLPKFTWVKGHADTEGNLYVDNLTQVAIAELELEKF